MDYKYINQLLDRYFSCETSVEEENILKAFFSQNDLPAELREYKAIFAYEHEEVKEDVLGKDFDERILAITEKPEHVKARIVTMQQRLMPLFKAAAVVAIFLTLGNAMQMSFNMSGQKQYNMAVVTDSAKEGVSVAMTDSAITDTLHRSSIDAQPSQKTVILK